MQHVSLSGERGGPACGWWKVECCMSEYRNNGNMWNYFLCLKDKNAKAVRREACHTFPSLERKGKGRKLCLLSANSYGIRDGVKRNVFFLQRASMRKLIKESMQHVSRSGEKGGPPAVGWWWKVESSMLECRKGCKCSEFF